MKQEHELLEQDWARFCGLVPECVVACSSGTAALHLALECVRQSSSNTLVYMPDYTMVACPRAAALAGLTPVFCDVDAHTGLMTVETFKRVWRGNAAAVIVPHIYGRRVNVNSIRDVVGDKVAIIEDLAEAHGIQPSRCSDIACWSFYKNKIVAGEEGGALASRFHPEWMDLARSLRTLGFTEAHDYTHIPYGHNYRMANLLAAPIRESIREYVNNIAWRRAVEQLHNEHCPKSWQMPYRDMPWVYDIRIPGMSKTIQKMAVDALRAAGHAVRYGFKPMTSLPEFAQVQLPNAATLSREMLYFPLDSALTVGSVIDKFVILQRYM